MNKHYGYKRVSSIEQNVERQKLELIEWGIIERLYGQGNDKIAIKDSCLQR